MLKRKEKAKLLFLPILAVVMGMYAQQASLKRNLLLDAGILFVAGALLLFFALRRLPDEPADNRGRLTVLVGLPIIFSVAVALRFVDTATLPEGVWFDEAQNGLIAQRILEEPNFRPAYVSEGSTHFPAFYLYLMATSIKLFGFNIFSVRIVAGIIGSLTILATYLLGKELFGWRVGLTASALMAIDRWHFSASRLGMSGVLAGFFAALGAYFLLRGLRRRSHFDFACAGISLGFGLHSYLAFNLVPVAIALWLLHRLVGGRLDFARAHYRGLILAAVVAGAMFLPIGIFAAQHPSDFTKRVGTVWIFKDKPAEQHVSILRTNIEKHLLMFNYRGDNNGRHNLPGEPMLDPLTGALFALGFLTSILLIRRHQHFLLILWVLIMILPGIFSLDFEAPQSWRSIGVVPGVGVLAAWVLGSTWRGLEMVLGRGNEKFAALPIVGLLALSGYWNYETYFVRGKNDFTIWSAHSIQETLIARQLEETSPDTRIIVEDTFLNRPTIKFMVPEFATQEPFDLASTLPLRDQRDTAIFLDGENVKGFNLLRELYPNAQSELRTASFGGPVVLRSVFIPEDQISSIQGLVARYYRGGQPSEEPAITSRVTALDFDWALGTPIPPPFYAEWRGTLVVPTYGRYELELIGPVGLTLSIDETEVLTGGQTRSKVLALGTHPIAIHGVVDQATPVRLTWQIPGQEKQVLGHGALYMPQVKVRGLLGRYYQGPGWQGPPKFERIDPSLNIRFHLRPLQPPYSVEWEGKVDIPRAGSYRFGTQSIDRSWLYIDNQLVVDNGQATNQYLEGGIELTEGLHDIRVRYTDETDHTFIKVFWVPPGRDREPIPSDRLFPEWGSYPVRAGPTETTSRPERLESSRTTLRPSPLSPILVFGSPGEGEGELLDPRGVAVDADGNVYVADTGNARIKKFNPTGDFVGSWGAEGGAEDQLREPTEIAIDNDGALVVLDSETGWIRRYSPTGELVDKLAGPSAGMYKPRGLDIDSEGNFHVADTGMSRVLVLSPGGQIIQIIEREGEASDQFREPVDVLVDQRGNIFIADAVNSRLSRLDYSWNHLMDWPLSEAFSLRGAHLAPAGDGTIWVTDPSSGAVVRYSIDGQPIERLGGSGQLVKPVGIAVDANGNVYVADAGQHRVIKFGVTPSPQQR